jgi:hypothetical protein
MLQFKDEFEQERRQKSFTELSYKFALSAKFFVNGDLIAFSIQANAI